MKNRIYITLLSVLLCVSMNAQQVSENFYYYQGEKIFLQQRTDKIYLKFVQNVSKEQIKSIISNDTSLLASGITLYDDYIPNSIIFEAKGGKQISAATIESLKNRAEVISVNLLFQYNNAQQGLTDEFVVKLKGTTSYGQLQALATKNNCSVGEENQFVKNQFMVKVSKTSNFNALQMSNLFYETGLFEFSEPNFVVLNAFFSNDPLFNQQYYLKNTGQTGGTSGIDINAEQAWTFSTGSNVKIAVIDEGVDLNHPDLQTHLLSGFDLSGNNSGGAPVWSTDNHGTACAGIIGAIQNNGEGISGVAPNCRIIPIHVSNSSGIPNDWAANAINLAWQNGADVISNSWGGSSPYTPLTNAINSAVVQGRGGMGCVVVFSSGNAIPYINVVYPANLLNVLAVGAIDKNGTIWNYSCRGTAMDLVAPSGDVNLNGDVVTTDRIGINGYETGNYTQRFGGTSAACPQVSGVAALMLSVNPNLTETQVRTILQQTARDLGPAGFDNTYGYGLVDAYAAVQKAFFISGPNQLCGTATYSVNNLPQDATITWSYDNMSAINLATSIPFVFVSGQGTGTLVVQQGTMRETGTVVGLKPDGITKSSTSQVPYVGLRTLIATITLNGQTLVLSKDVYIGPYTPVQGLYNMNNQQVSSGNVGVNYNFKVINANDYSATPATPSYPGFEWLITTTANSNTMIWAGASMPYITSTPQTLTTKVRYSCDCGTTVYNTKNFSFTGSNFVLLYPNPASGNVDVTVEQEIIPVSDNDLTNYVMQPSIEPYQGAYTLQLWSSTALLQTINSNTPTTQISLSGLLPDIYYLRLIIDNQVVTTSQLIVN